MPNCKHCGAEIGDSPIGSNCGAEVAVDSQERLSWGESFALIPKIPRVEENCDETTLLSRAKSGVLVGDKNPVGPTAPELPGFFRAYALFWKNYAVPDGRSSRREFWYVLIWQTVLTYAAMFLPLLALIVATGTFTTHVRAISTVLASRNALPVEESIAEDESPRKEESIADEDEFLDDEDNYGPLAGLELVPLVLGGGPFLLITIIPMFCLVVRRLHDANISGWASLLFFIPFVGKYRLLFFVVAGLLPPTKGPNKYGPAPAKRVNA
ncbi:MAG: DUF805 domain-containing protein [Thermoguttaceae bacterium]|nr:DUF805 domain-containing protein [Thermoguttaceae bacterium]